MMRSDKLADKAFRKEFNDPRGRIWRILKPAMASNEVLIDLAEADTFWVELTDDLDDITVTLPRATDELRFDWRLILQQDAGGGNAVTWPAAWNWPTSAPPVVSAAADAIDIFDFMVIDDAYYGRVFGQAMAP